MSAYSSRMPATRRIRASLTCLVVALLCSAIAWYARAPMLRAAADAWIVSDPLAPADAVAIFGGGLETRPYAAADYYRAGLVNRILLADVRLSPSERLGAVVPHAALNRAVLAKLGVPLDRIEQFGTSVSNTYDEALALRAWARRTHAAAVIVPTESFASRRVRGLVSRALAGTQTRVLVLALDSPDYTRADWWRSEQGVIAFQNELLKYVYYRVKYRSLQPSP